MDLWKDELYNWDAPLDTPCRWIVNVMQCKDSHFFITGMAITMAFAALALVLGCILLALQPLDASTRFRPWRWNSSRLLYAGIIVGMAFLVTHCVILLSDPAMPYWPRALVYTLPFAIFYSSFVPHLLNLVAKGYLPRIDNTGSYSLRHAIRVSLYSIPLFVCLGSGLVVAAVASMDRARNVVYAAFFAAGFSLYVLPSLIIMYTCWRFGVRFARAIEVQLAEMEDRPRPSALPHQYSPPHPSSPPQTSPHSLSPPHNSSELARLSKGPYHHPSRALATVEAIAVLRKMRGINLICIQAFLSGTIYSVLMIALPHRIFSDIVLSKICLLLFHICIPISSSILMVTSLHAETRKRKERRFISLNTQDILGLLNVPSTDRKGPPSHSIEALTEHIELTQPAPVLYA